MFEDEGWNINEDDFNSDDIFKDNNDKEQIVSATKDSETKKKVSVTLNTTELKRNIYDNSQSNMILQSNESVSQKNVVLDIFKSVSSSQEVFRNDQKDSSSLANEEEPENLFNETNESRRNLILNVFQDSAARPKPIAESVLKIPDGQNKLKRKKNVAFLDFADESNAAKKLCTEKSNKPQEVKKNNMNTDPENQISSLESITHSTGDASHHKKKELTNLSKSSGFKTSIVPRVKHAVVRQFPGPAGILPDDINENDIIDLDDLVEKKNNKSNQYANVCSQNTKNLFTTGAWQLMMDDLPADFELVDIATIKENAKQYSKTYKKVPYMAGIVQYIDYKPNDPHIILKDLSGKVDARIHHSICKLYPNALGTSIVMLVKDVGLILTSKKFVCVIISLSNLVSIYSDEARLVETPHLKTLLKNDNSDQRLHESQISVLDEDEGHDNNKMSQIHSQEIRNSLQQQPRSILKNKYYVEKTKENNCIGFSELNIIRKEIDKYKNDKIRNEPERTNYNHDLHEFELDEDDSWLNVNIDELNSFKAHQFPSSTPMDSHEKNLSDASSQVKRFKNVDLKEVKHLPDSEKIVPGMKQLPITNDKCKTTSDKLLAFRHPDDIVKQPIISKQICLRENISSVTGKQFECENNDTDDEMLSQLDVDAIAANYSTQNC